MFKNLKKRLKAALQAVFGKVTEDNNNQSPSPKRTPASKTSNSNPRNLYGKDEVTLCTYVALYGDEDTFGGSALNLNRLERYCERTEASVRMKVGNISLMLDQNGYFPVAPYGKLGGKRNTNWDIVYSLITLEQSELGDECNRILATKGMTR